jgi:hypothetical protein
LTLDEGDVALLFQIMQWLEQHSIHKLNIAGPRESSRPGVYDAAKRLLLKLLSAER